MSASNLTDQTREQMREIVGRYPQTRPALMPMLHLVQAEEGYITSEGIEMCAEVLGLSTAEVKAVATFYTMYKHKPIGEYHVGVCTNTLCAVMGGDAIFSDLTNHLGIGNDHITADGKVHLEHIECNAACDFAPVIPVNGELFDNQTRPADSRLFDDLPACQTARATSGGDPVGQ